MQTAEKKEINKKINEVLKLVDEVREEKVLAVKEEAQKTLTQIKSRLTEVYNESSDKAIKVKENTEDKITNNPFKAVFSALGVGLVLGFLFRSRGRK